jgi:hypothetical protein
MTLKSQWGGGGGVDRPGAGFDLTNAPVLLQVGFRDHFRLRVCTAPDRQGVNKLVNWNKAFP